MTRSTVAITAVAVHHEVGQRFELLAMRVAVEARSRAIGVVECHRPRLLERARGGDADERTVQRAAGESLVHDAILPRGEQQRQRRRPLSQVDAGDLARLCRLAGAVEDVVGDLERDAERGAELAEPGILTAAAEEARGLEELARLQGAPLEIALDRRIRVVRLAALQSLAAGEAQRRVGEQLDGLGVPRLGQLGERAGEQVVAGRARRPTP